MKTHAMIDIETLNTSCGTSVITQVGGVKFNMVELVTGSQFQRGVFVQPQVAAGRTVSDSTLEWWMEEVKGNPLGDAKMRRHPAHIAQFLETWMEDVSYVWANGITFDLGNIQGMCESLGVNWPWAYNVGMDVRTLRRILGEPGFENPEHGAMADAIAQAEAVLDWNKRHAFLEQMEDREGP